MKNYFKGFLLIGFLFSFLLSPNLIHAQVDPNTISPSECVDLKNNLKFGDKDINKNGEVTLLQKYLRANGYLTIAPSGYLGSSTFKAVIEFQKANSLKPAFGYVGSLTREKIKVLTCAGEVVTESCFDGIKNGDEIKVDTGGSCTQTCPNGTTGTYPNCIKIVNPTVSLSANPLSIESGGSIQLTWNSTNAESCVASSGWSGNKSIFGNQVVYNLTTTTEFTLTCTGAGGSTTNSVQVGVYVVDPIVCPNGTTGTYPNCVKIVCPAGTTGTYPNCVPTPATLTFTASPINVYLGNNITLSWIATRVGICQASGDWSGYKDVSGSEKINVNSLGYKTYNLSCKNEGGPLSVDKSVTINSTQNPLYPTGCSSNSGYSVITGLSCANTNTNNNTNTNVTNTASSDKTPRVSIWGTKLSQYLNDQGFWVTDLNSGYVHTNEILRFCKKWYPTTTSVEYYKEEYIPNWVNLSTGASETFYSNHFSYKCVGGTHSGPSKVLGVSTSIEASVSNLPNCSLSKNLMKGMQDEEVKCLQEKLNNKGYNVKGTENRKEITFFGYNTLLALKKFQKDNNLKSDGILGLSTRKLLNE